MSQAPIKGELLSTGTYKFNSLNERLIFPILIRDLCDNFTFDFIKIICDVMKWRFNLNQVINV